ncbi:hypothetical protein Nwat_1550 [Nitrosococcus watsonii C-113]|uniref:Uncharacterized protein n=1 Tax=Nitrosococcus watsoni (strain C-113) TaxID=105559 RepID=D8K6C3_NITWC|nr:hypothetical protein Nwat_1550 [Nitrosococcus watsonii C-113]
MPPEYKVNLRHCEHLVIGTFTQLKCHAWRTLLAFRIILNNLEPAHPKTYIHWSPVTA